MSEDKKAKTYRDFKDLVNMNTGELAAWLETDEAKSVGWIRDGGLKTAPGCEKSEGYKSGEMILDILPKSQDELTDYDYSHMQRVTGYIKRHLAQHPNKDTSHTRWRYSLMNWGHDPLKD